MHFFQLEIRQKKRDILSEKLESGVALKKREFTPESGTVDTYAILAVSIFFTIACHCSMLISVLLTWVRMSFNHIISTTA